jgi:hypothetical protein
MNDIINLLEKKNNNPDVSNLRVICESEYLIRRDTLEKLKDSCIEHMSEYKHEIVRGKIICDEKNLSYRLAAIIYCINMISRLVDSTINYNDEDDRV